MSGDDDVDPPDDDMEMLAAEYVLGLLSVAQLPHVVAQRQGGVRFDQAVQRWELRLLPLAQAVDAVEPPAGIWRAISAAIAPVQERGGIWDNVRFWRGFGIGAGLLGAGFAAALVAVLSTSFVPARPVATATLVSQHDGVFVATAQQTHAGIQLVISPAQVVGREIGRALVDYAWQEPGRAWPAGERTPCYGQHSHSRACGQYRLGRTRRID